VAAVSFDDAIRKALLEKTSVVETAGDVLAAWSIGQAAARERVRELDEDLRRAGRLVFADAEAMR
jgi:hypothetical protein